MAQKQKTTPMKKKTTSKKTTGQTLVTAKKTKVITPKATPAKSSSSKAKPIKKVSVPSVGGLQVGDKLPATLVVESTNGSFKFSDLKGQKIILYFYPKDHTSGCTVEGHDFSNALKDFKKYKTQVFGVSRDSMKSHFSFIEKQKYNMPLISDPEEVLCHVFGVMKEKSLYGRKYVGVDRSTFLINEKGILVQEWRNVKIPGHVAEVLNAVKALK